MAVSVRDQSPVAAPRLIAHRGGVVGDGRGENSRAALEEAVRRGYYGIETDVRESADGAAFCLHDPTPQREFGEPRPLAELTRAELQALRRRGSGEPPLCLSELAEQCGGRLVVMLDLKQSHSGDAFLRQVRGTLAAARLLDSCYVIGNAAARRFFLGQCKVGIRGHELTGLLALHDAGPRPAESRFLFDHGPQLSAQTVTAAQRAGVEIVPSINWQHFPLAPRLRARRHLQRLYRLGVRTFQIDDPFATYLNAEGAR